MGHQYENLKAYLHSLNQRGHNHSPFYENCNFSGTKHPVEPLKYSCRVFQKNLTLGISKISLATNTLEPWYIFHLKGGIHSSVWNIKQAQLGVPHSRIQVELGLILQAGT